MKNDAVAPYAVVIIKLLQDVLYQEDTANWDLLLRYVTPIREYFGKIGLEVQLYEAEGYAYLHQPDGDTHEEERLPRLVRRDKLTYDVTLLGVLLREKLLQFETSGSNSPRLVLSKDEIREMIRLFFKERTDEVRLWRDFDTAINRMVELGFLKRLTGAENNLFEVRRILKAKFSTDTLVEIKQKLQTYVESSA
ncbi:MAG: DUF4194 domain-containing protein [Anaerolineae bacterium]|nr:DUF4194 domain-containing protein [Anaerolineae bacterium]